jgi:hypothetical protein
MKRLKPEWIVFLVVDFAIAVTIVVIVLMKG